MTTFRAAFPQVRPEFYPASGAVGQSHAIDSSDAIHRLIVDSLRIKTGRIDLVTAHPLPYEDRSPGRMSGRVLRDRRDDAGS